MSSAFRTLLLAHHTGDTSATGRAIAQFADRVAQRSGGLLNIANVPRSTLGNIPALLRMVIDGETDMAFAPYDRLSAVIPKFGCVGLPFVFDDHAHAERILTGSFSDWALPDLLRHGLHSLSSWDWGFRQITNNRRPVLHPEDLHGLRIRVPPILLNQESMLALGALPVVVEFAQMVRALQQGLVDGQENPVAIIHGHKLHETQRHLTLINYSYGAMLHIINRKSFESLSAEHQYILDEESRHASQTLRQELRTQEAQQIDALQHLGMHVVRPDPAPFRAGIAPARTRLTEVFGAKRTATFMEMIAHFRQPGLPEQSS